MQDQKSVLLVNAPFFELYGSRGVSHYFPLGIGYIAAYLEKHGFSVVLITEDGQTDVRHAVTETLRNNIYLVVGISCMTPSLPAAVRLAKTVRTHAPGTPVILGGPHVSAVGKSILDDCPDVDYLALAEGEVTMLRLSEALCQGTSRVDDIPGLAWRTESGTTVSNAPGKFEASLDNFPYPARHLVEFHNFSLHSHVSLGRDRGATMITSRGCPFNCIFCSAHLTHGRAYRFHSEDYVIGEIKLLRDRHDIRYIFFEDDSFTVVRERVHALCKRIVEEQLGITFGCFSRVDVFDEDMARSLSKAGCRMVIFGIESGVPEVLTRIRKGTSIDKATLAVELCKKYQISSYASFVVGLPFETVDMIRKTIAFGKQLDASIVTFNPFVPFPGTPLFDSDKHTPQQLDGWTKFLTTDAPPFQMVPGLSPEELRSMVGKAHLSFYLRPKRILELIRQIGSVSELISLAKSFATVVRAAVPAKGDPDSRRPE